MANLFFQTEGTTANGADYESAACLPESDAERRKFAHDLLDEFLDAFARDHVRASLTFGPCSIHQHCKNEE